MLNLPVAVPGLTCKRGLYVAPWLGDNGEIILVAVREDRRLAAPPLEIPWGADSVAIAEQLQERLDEVDPPRLRLI